MVTCPTCETVRQCWVYEEVGKAGWTAELNEGEDWQRAMAYNVMDNTHDCLDRIAELVDVERRIGFAK